MAFDTFDEGIVPGGMRSKSEIKTLICYLYYSVNENISKDIIVQAIQKDSLANYFETSAAFDDLVANGNLTEYGSEDEDVTFILTDNGKMIANQLETTLSYTVKEKAYICATKLLAEKKTERENSVDIVRIDNGFNVVCKISGGSTELMSFSLYAPSFEQAMIMKSNFYDSPSTIYKVMLALLSKDRDNVGEALEEIYGVL